MDPFEINRLTPAPENIPTGQEHLPPRHGPGGKFLKGPIPWDWLLAASALPGKALAVGLVVWREAGCRNARTVPVNLSHMAMPRRTAQRGLQSLLTAGLVSVQYRDGRPTLVTLRHAPDPDAGEKYASTDPTAMGEPVRC